MKSRYSPKLFVGAVPPECSEALLSRAFSEFGLVELWWPNKSEQRLLPGYVFATFRGSDDVSRLLRSCIYAQKRYGYWLVHMNKYVEIRPFALDDAAHIADPLWSRFLRLSIFVGGIPRTTTAPELAAVVSQKFGRVLHCSLELEYPSKYPKGAGRIVFRHIRSYTEAVNMKRIVLQFGEESRSVEIKPYVYRGIPCESCQLPGECDFCAECLQYFCKSCWSSQHVMLGIRHQPLNCSQREMPAQCRPVVF